MRAFDVWFFVLGILFYYFWGFFVLFLVGFFCFVLFFGFVLVFFFCFLFWFYFSSLPFHVLGLFVLKIQASGLFLLRLDGL